MKTKGLQEKVNFRMELSYLSQNEFLNHIFQNKLIKLQKVGK